MCEIENGIFFFLDLLGDCSSMTLCCGRVRSIDKTVVCVLLQSPCRGAPVVCATAVSMPWCSRRTCHCSVRAECSRVYYCSIRTDKKFHSIL